MKRGILIAIGAFVAGLLALQLVQLACGRKPSVVERHVDSTLAERPAWLKDTLRVRDSIQANGDRNRAALRKQNAALEEAVRYHKHRTDSLETEVKKLSTITPGSASDSVAQLLPLVEGQKRALAQFRIQTGVMDFQHHRDSLALAESDATIAQERRWRAQDERRLDKVTRDLGNLRDETRHRGEWHVLGAWVPGWTKDALLVVGTAYLTTRVCANIKTPC